MKFVGSQTDMSIANLSNLSYWFAIVTPGFKQWSLIIAIVMLAVVLVIGIAARVLARSRKSNPPLCRALVRASRPFLFFAITGFILVWFRQLGAAVLSARFWLVFVFVISVIWFVWIFIKVRKNYEREYERLEAEKKYKAYLPKRKK